MMRAGRLSFATLAITWTIACVRTDPSTPGATAHSANSIVPVGSLGLLRVSTVNPRYFVDGTGAPVYLAGAHTWSNFQDQGRGDPPPVFDYGAYLEFLVQHGHNFTKFWSFEHVRWTADFPDDDFWTTPVWYVRTGPDLALDGKPKFDLTQFNPAYFDRLRQRIVAAGQRGIYVSVMVFEGESVKQKVGNAWRGHPYHRSNNINGIDGDPDDDNQGLEAHRLQVPAITALQQAYIRHLVDAVNDLDNVLYEISLEDPAGAEAWQQQMIVYLKQYEATKPKQHPVGMTALYPGGQNSDLYASAADWISPNGTTGDTPAADGSKVILQDTDHLCGACTDRAWVWKSLTRGVNLLLMDPYDGVWGNSPSVLTDPAWQESRNNLGYALAYAKRLNLLAMRPHDELASTGYCLANPIAQAAEYLVYLPSGGIATVDLRATAEPLDVEWFVPSRGLRIRANVSRGGDIRTFTSPVTVGTVLYLRAHRSTAPPPRAGRREGVSTHAAALSPRR